MTAIEQRSGFNLTERRKEQASRITFLKAHPEFDYHLSKKIVLLQIQNIKTKAKLKGDSPLLREAIVAEAQSAAVVMQIPLDILTILDKIVSFHRKDISVRHPKMAHPMQDYFARKKAMHDLEEVRKSYGKPRKEPNNVFSS